MSFYKETKISPSAQQQRGQLAYAFKEARNRHTVSLGDKGLLRPKHGPTLRAVNWQGLQLLLSFGLQY